VFPKGCQVSWDRIRRSRKVTKHLGEGSGVPENPPLSPFNSQLSTFHYPLSTIHYSLLNHRHHHPKVPAQLGVLGLWAVGAADKSIKIQGLLAALAYKVLGKIVKAHGVGTHGKIGMAVGENAHAIADIDIVAAGLKLTVDGTFM
jgi:hypothetical protein